MKQIFEKENINSGRQLELDIGRGLAVLFMIFVHVLEFFSNGQIQNSIYGEIVEFFGSPPAAPVFMFLLGAGIVYSKKSAPNILFKRGLIIFFGGYLLNILRGTLPSIIGFFLTGENEYLQTSISQLISVDILQFAGLALIYFAIVKRLKLNFITILISGILLSFINLFLLNSKVDNLLLSAICSLFWGASEISYFPFLSWILYPIAGYCFGTFLIRCINKSGFYLLLLILGGILFITSGFITINILNIDIGITDDYAYYHQNILGNIVYISFVLMWLSLLFFISKAFTGILKTTVERWSRNVTVIYCIHWVLIGAIGVFIGMNNCNLLVTVVMSIIIVIVSDILAVRYNKKRRKRTT